MGLREKIARRLAPQLKNDTEIRDIVRDEVKRARMALPAGSSFDPHGEGYRRLMGGQRLRDLLGVDQVRMFEVAYWMWDNSAMTKGLASMDRAFLFGEPVTIEAADEDVQVIVDRFWDDPENNMNIEYPNLAMWLGLLGEQCWPVTVYPQNGACVLGYEDPSEIADIYTSRLNKKTAVQVEMAGDGGRPGKKYQVVRIDRDPRSKTYGKLVGECFFFAINHPPNSPRGRSDFLTLFDWIDGLERYGYNFIERAEHLLNYVWDITLNGYTEDECREWLKNNPPPQPGSQRAHNQECEWKAVAPDIKAPDARAGYDMGKSFIMGAARRPESWFGGGGKAYQTEAEQFGQVPLKDLDERQLLHKHIIKMLVTFAVDQAVIAGRLSEEKAAAGFTVNLPELSKKDLSKAGTVVSQLSTALMVAETQEWVSHEEAVKIWAFVAGFLGYEIDPEAQPMEKAGGEGDDENGVTADYRKTPLRVVTGDKAGKSV